MTLRLFLCFGFLSFAIPGCDGNKASLAPKPPASGQKDEEEEHTHGAGPNGGVVFDLGNYHGEFTVNHKTRECIIVILRGNAKDPIAVACKSLTVKTLPVKAGNGKVVPAMTIKLLPKDEAMGKASTFVGIDLVLANEVDYGGTVEGEINGKPVNGKFQELPETPK